MMEKKITIGKAATASNVSIETIRYYQRRQLIQEPPKPLDGYRHYPDETISQIKFIKRAQSIGFSLKEIETLLELGNQQCSETRDLASSKLVLVKNKIKDLRSIERTLKDLITHCELSDNDEYCPLIDSISQ